MLPIRKNNKKRPKPPPPPSILEINNKESLVMVRLKLSPFEFTQAIILGSYEHRYNTKLYFNFFSFVLFCL